MRWKEGAYKISNIYTGADPTKQTLARARNQFRFRLNCVNEVTHAGNVPLTSKEKALLNTINKAIEELKEEWTEGSKELGFNIKPYTCAHCTKKASKEHLVIHNKATINLCSKCKYLLENGTQKPKRGKKQDEDDFIDF